MTHPTPNTEVQDDASDLRSSEIMSKQLHRIRVNNDALTALADELEKMTKVQT